MKEILRTNDLVEISWAKALLHEHDIPVLELDQHVSAVEGSIGAIPRRLMVADDDLSRARWLLNHYAVPDAGADKGD